MSDIFALPVIQSSLEHYCGLAICFSPYAQCVTVTGVKGSLLMVLEVRFIEFEVRFCSLNLPKFASCSQDEVAAVEQPSVATARCPLAASKQPILPGQLGDVLQEAESKSKAHSAPPTASYG